MYNYWQKNIQQRNLKTDKHWVYSRPISLFCSSHLHITWHQH